MILREGKNSLEIVVLDRVPPHLPTPGDIKLSITVEANGFSGRGSAWVASKSLNDFVGDLRTLEATRSGMAAIVSMSADVFRLRIQIVDSAGHTVIEGRIANRQQTLEFRFPFDPGQLATLLAEFAAFATP